MAHDLAEHVAPPRRRDISFYLVLLLAVFPIWLLPPLCWAFVAHALWSDLLKTFHWPGKALFAFALTEVVFSVYHHSLVRRAAGSSPHPPGDIKELQTAFKRILQTGLASRPDDAEGSLDADRPGSPEEDITQLSPTDRRAVDFRNQLRTWFGKVAWSSIHLQQVLEWLYWSTYNEHLPSSPEDIPEAHQIALDEAVDMLQKRSGTTFPQGSNPAATPLKLTLDPVYIYWRPLVWYTGVAVSNQFLRRYFKHYWNVRHDRHDDLEYLLRVPPGWTPATGPQPIVFLHGLGLGLAQYCLIINHLLNILPAHPILIPLQPHISQDIFHKRYLAPMGRKETVEKIFGAVQKLGWEESGITILSHSNGSYAHAWILKAHPDLVKRSCFVDPVTFCSWEGDVCYNFIYRPCTTGIELILKYYVGGELGVANLLQRHFDWCSNSLWFEEIPNANDPSRTVFFLGGKDIILSAERVTQYLRTHGVRKGLWIDPEGQHGQAFIVGGKGLEEIVRWIHDTPSSLDTKVKTL